MLKRDVSGATLEDHFDKTILPKVMQVGACKLSSLTLVQLAQDMQSAPAYVHNLYGYMIFCNYRFMYPASKCDVRMYVCNCILHY